MPDEIETSRAVPAPARRDVPQGWSGGWIGRNERFLRTVFMISVYVFGALCLISVLVLGAFAFITGVLLGLVLVAALGIVILLNFRRLRR
jgi:hypothetical protein